MLDGETLAFMRRSLLAGRLRDGVHPLAQAGRRAAFRIRKKALGGRRGRETAAREIPDFPEDVDWHAALPPGVDLTLDDRRHILTDFAAHSAGFMRLAGGRMHRVAEGRLGEVRDREDAHAYHRLYWLLRLAKASYLGQGGTAFVSGWRDWLSDPSRGGLEAQAAYTTGERICSLEESLFWTADSDLGQRRLAILQQLWLDAWTLQHNVEYSLGLHNHVLQNGRALLRAARLFGAEGRVFHDQAVLIGNQFWPALVDSDGVLREQSSHYHVLLSRAALDYLYLGGQASGLSSTVISRLKRMFDLTDDLVRPGGDLPRFGDSSPDATAADLRGLGTAAWRLGATPRPPRDRAVTTLTLYYSASDPSGPQDRRGGLQRAYQESGFAFLSTADGRLEAAIHADPRPEAFGHGNCARGAFEVCWDGSPLIREPGAFRDFSHPRRSLQRTPRGHNVCSVGNLAPALDADAKRRFSTWYGNEAGEIRIDPDGALRYRWAGFQRRYPDVSLERSWQIADGRRFVFEERVTGGRRLPFESRLHLGDLAYSEPSSSEGQYRLACSGVGKPWAAILEFDVDSGLRVSTEPSWTNPEYGVEAPATVVVVRGTVQLPCRWGLEIRILDEEASDIPRESSAACSVTAEAH